MEHNCAFVCCLFLCLALFLGVVNLCSWPRYRGILVSSNCHTMKHTKSRSVTQKTSRKRSHAKASNYHNKRAWDLSLVHVRTQTSGRQFIKNSKVIGRGNPVRSGHVFSTNLIVFECHDSNTCILQALTVLDTD